jgi:hypothetical protein
MNILYHVTTKERAAKIATEGFHQRRIYFTPKQAVKFWVDTLCRERNLQPNQIVVLEMAFPPDFYDREMYDWSTDQHSEGPPQVSYGEGPQGWNNPQQRPRLTPDLFQITRTIPWTN